MQGIDLAHGFSVKLARVRRFVEIQVATEDLVRPFAGKHHLHTHGLYPTGEQVHRRRRTDRRHVIGFDMPDHLGQGVESFLKHVAETVMHGAERFGRNFSRSQIGRAFKSDRK